ncbi:YeeE/YedE family protein [Rubrobacter marinus]|uniref:YeeE/YedE family protein n=1 Tax=Rubrobacter marinus TaxID=2653852 RepID=A0A6G8PT34_9ACTN|nr:YeeE/YedE family protein [Rubrobacter marinus]QIN77590.1 YeeE/YedE family protein [Rubrobacter marinus]
MDGFTPVSGLLGGMMIGLAATLLLLLNGRISGISGIVGGLVSPGTRRGAGWRVAFVAGLVLGAFSYAAAAGGLPGGVEASVPVLVIAGLLVGFGTRLGSGCTSGHGVCGIARLSKRSIVATAVFMGVAALTVFVSHHVI